MSNVVFPGAALRERRESMGYTLMDVHHSTHVPVSYLKTLEDGNVHALPVETYTTGFIASYCQFIGVAPEPYLDRYHLCLRERQYRNAPAEDFVTFLERPKPAWLQDAITWGGICAFLLIAWLTYATFTKPMAEDTERVEAGTIQIKPPTHFEEDF
jgi:cytoskeleton protein RodZ